MKVNIVCSDPTWIYGQFIDKFKLLSKNEILLNAKSGFDVAHYLPYYEIPKKPFAFSTAWMSHMENKEPLKTKFLSSARLVSCAISHSKKYADLLKRMGIKNVVQIMPGVELDKFVPNSETYKSNKPLVVGYVGRAYSSSNRKNPTLIDRVSKIEGIIFKATNGKIPADKMPEFYNSVDLIISPSTVEGGPMAIQEALAVGKPVICFQSVGVSDEFDFGLVKVPDFNEDKFIKIIEDWRDGTLVLNPPKVLAVSSMRNQVLPFTWENFVAKHDEVWEQVCAPLIK